MLYSLVKTMLKLCVEYKILHSQCIQLISNYFVILRYKHSCLNNVGIYRVRAFHYMSLNACSFVLYWCEWEMNTSPEI